MDHLHVMTYWYNFFWSYVFEKWLNLIRCQWISNFLQALEKLRFVNSTICIFVEELESHRNQGLILLQLSIVLMPKLNIPRKCQTAYFNGIPVQTKRRRVSTKEVQNRKNQRERKSLQGGPFIILYYINYSCLHYSSRYVSTTIQGKAVPGWIQPLGGSLAVRQLRCIHYCPNHANCMVTWFDYPI